MLPGHGGHGGVRHGPRAGAGDGPGGGPGPSPSAEPGLRFCQSQRSGPRQASHEDPEPHIDGLVTTAPRKSSRDDRIGFSERSSLAMTRAQIQHDSQAATARPVTARWGHRIAPGWVRASVIRRYSSRLRWCSAWRGRERSGALERERRAPGQRTAASSRDGWRRISSSMAIRPPGAGPARRRGSNHMPSEGHCRKPGSARSNPELLRLPEEPKVTVEAADEGDRRPSPRWARCRRPTTSSVATRKVGARPGCRHGASPPPAAGRQSRVLVKAIQAVRV